MHRKRTKAAAINGPALKVQRLGQKRAQAGCGGPRKDAPAAQAAPGASRDRIRAKIVHSSHPCATQPCINESMCSAQSMLCML